MMRDVLFLVRNDLVRLLRVREVVLWTFIMPIAFFFFLGTITRSNSPGDSKDVLAVAVAPDAGFLADRIVDRLAERDYRIVRASAQTDARRLEIPSGFTESVLAGRPMAVRFTRTGESLDADYDRIRLSRAVYAVVADLLVMAQEGGTVTPERLVQLNSAPRPLTMEVKPAGRRKRAPSGFEQSVPGTMVMFTLLVLFTSGAVSITNERNQGILRRLASSPMSRGSVVLGKWGVRMGLGAVQIAFAMITGSVLFGVNWGPNLAAIILVMLAYGALAAALGMLLGNWGRTEGQVIGLGVIASNIFAALGGCWWPIEVTPLWAQKLALVFPTGWVMDALHKLMSFGASPASVLPHLAVMTVAAVAAGYAVSRSLRFQ